MYFFFEFITEQHQDSVLFYYDINQLLQLSLSVLPTQQ